MKLVSLFVAYSSSLMLFTALPAAAEGEPVEETVIPGAGAPPAEAARTPAAEMPAAETPAAEPAPSDAATAAAAPAEPAPASEMAPQAQQPSPVRRVAREGRIGRDARHCLDLATNSEIIKCAEKYR